MGDSAQEQAVDAYELARHQVEISCPADVSPEINGVAKRALDLFVAIPLAVFVLPLLVAIAIAIRLSDGKEAIFRHRRYGRGGREFTCYKFRTMVADASSRLAVLLSTDPLARNQWMLDQKLQNDPRITPIGRFLRKTSLDELPQLFNIIRGDMSLVGPRPIVYGEIAKYDDLFPYYAATRPGVTGLWQVSGRNHTTYGRRVQLDVEYVRTWSLLKDLTILIRTIPAVILSRGAF